jgi:hypothetical protein
MKARLGSKATPGDSRRILDEIVERYSPGLLHVDAAYRLARVDLCRGLSSRAILYSMLALVR